MCATRMIAVSQCYRMAKAYCVQQWWTEKQVQCFHMGNSGLTWSSIVTSSLFNPRLAFAIPGWMIISFRNCEYTSLEGYQNIQTVTFRNHRIKANSGIFPVLIFFWSVRFVCQTVIFLNLTDSDRNSGCDSIIWQPLNEWTHILITSALWGKCPILSGQKVDS